MRGGDIGEAVYMETRFGEAFLKGLLTEDIDGSTAKNYTRLVGRGGSLKQTRYLPKVAERLEAVKTAVLSVEEFQGMETCDWWH